MFWITLTGLRQNLVSNTMDSAVRCVAVRCERTLLIPMLDKEWSDAANFYKQWHPESLKYTYDNINRYKQYNSNDKRQFSLYTYKYMPYYTGLMIDDEFLFLALCQWGKKNSDESKYEVGLNPYTLYTKNKGKEHDHYIKQYQYWFSYCKKHSANSQLENFCTSNIK